ncbi:MAG: nitrite reductase [Gammaproteobacteria bacterium]|nr:nitrite reductase [Gammaproteobacteria bacterium]
MNKLAVIILICFSINIVQAGSLPEHVQKTKENFKTHCASCHGENRLGLMGPALLPENLKRLKQKAAHKVITEGRAATQMPSFKDKLDTGEIMSLVDYIYTPLLEMPKWNMDDILSSQIVYPEVKKLPAKPVWDADPMNIFLVVELGDHHVTVLDGDTFNPIHRFASRFALHGGPKYSPDGRYVYFGSRDGWVTKYDLYNLTVVAEVRAGINMRNVAVSSDGKHVIAGNYLPHTLVILSADDLSPVKVIAVRNEAGDSSRVSAVYDAAPRKTFIAALKDIKEVWEISYEDEPPMGFGKWMHDYREDSGENAGLSRSRDKFPIRKIKTEDYLDDFFFNQSYELIIGSSRDKQAKVLDLDLGRTIKTLDLKGMPHMSSGITWLYKGNTVLATPNLKEGVVTIIDMQSWKTIKRIKTLGPGFFMRSHENSAYAWVDVFFGPNKDAVHIIDKSTLEIVKTLRPVKGKTAAHVEFDKQGKHALLSIWDMDGEVIVYDAKSFKEIKRLPMKKPSGKYNVYNKINRSSGTSH